MARSFATRFHTMASGRNGTPGRWIFPRFIRIALRTSANMAMAYSPSIICSSSATDKFFPFKTLIPFASAISADMRISGISSFATPALCWRANRPPIPFFMATAAPVNLRLSKPSPRFRDQGLRLIELKKSQLLKFPLSLTVLSSQSAQIHPLY